VNYGYLEVHSEAACEVADDDRTTARVPRTATDSQ